MAVGLYDPVLGRFLEVDPIEGGSANDYVYPADPVNGYDLGGLEAWYDYVDSWLPLLSEDDVATVLGLADLAHSHDFDMSTAQFVFDEGITDSVEFHAAIVGQVDWRKCGDRGSSVYGSSQCQRYRARPEDHVVERSRKPIWCSPGGYLVIGGTQSLGYAIGHAFGRAVTGPWGLVSRSF